MASSLVDIVVEKLGGMMIEQIYNEASLVLNFRKDFEWLSKKLTKIRSYLGEADLQSAHNKSVKSWLLDVAEIAFDAEDILDDCAVQSQGTHNETPQSSCVCAFSYYQLAFRYKMARRIKDVKDRMRSIMEHATELKLVGDVTHSDQPSTSTSQNIKWRGLRLNEGDSRPVAIESKVEEVLRLVDDPAAPVIAVVGMGGVGKTFLLKNVFDRAKDRFEKSIWLAVSQTYSLRNVYEVKPLPKEESWSLFCACAFPDNQQYQLPPQLEEIARKIEERCGGLPLAVKTVAASLADKRLSWEWESKLEQIRAASSTDDPTMEILKMSYDSLPAHLKPCFAYLSFFPEDEKIDSQYLINLWVAEGYIPQGEHQLDIGWNYICHLQSLCLVERVGEDIYDLEDRMFKMHDLLLDLAISIAKESQCAFSVEEAFKKLGPAVESSSRYRRILLGKKRIGDDDVDVRASNRAYSASRLRTLSFSQNIGIQNIPAILLSGARVLRVLDLSGTKILSLPACVGNLKLLRVLNLSWTNITEVPDCVKSNKNLLFLDIHCCPNLERLPEWIGELNCLQYLDIHPTFRNKFDGLMPKGISKLVSLQVLQLDGDNKLSVEDNEFLKLEHLVNLVNLRQVDIYIRHEGELKSIEDGILATLVKMRTLTIVNSVEGDDDVCSLPPISEKMLAMKDLEYLYLNGFAVPNWIRGFSNLMQLFLYNCHCAVYPALETMPNLIKLDLAWNRICKTLPKGFGKSGGFPQLRYFKIWSFSVLEELSELEDAAMPRLEILYVHRCPELNKVARGLEFLKSLKECKFDDTGVDCMFKKVGEVWNKMKANNPNVIINGHR